jgi:hypothetical protein
MSIEIRARISCDNCGSYIDGPVQTSMEGESSFGIVFKRALHRRWIFGAGELCNECADGQHQKAKPQPVREKR